MQVGLGSITCQQAPGDLRSDVERYRDAVALAVEAERLGFDSVWLSEHHFLDDGYLPSLLPFAAAIAARTERIAIGTDVLLAPLHEPIRLAEDAAVVDLLSNGRLVLGLAQGWRRFEFEGLNVPFRGRHVRFEETIEVLRQAWGPGLVTGGETLRYPEVSVTPKPARAGGPPLWIGAMLEPAVRRAARIGDGFVANWCRPAELARWSGWIRDEALAAGRDLSGFVFAPVIPFWVNDRDDEWPLIRDAVWQYVWKYDDMARMRGRTGPPPAPPPLTPEREEELRAMVIMGPADELVTRLRDYEAACGGELHVIADLLLPSLDPGLLRDQLARVSETLLPQLRAG
ncbi:MAG: LLM class flavin-dependent oxidoreductase [Gaiellales bacterium]